VEALRAEATEPSEDAERERAEAERDRDVPREEANREVRNFGLRGTVSSRCVGAGDGN
jgi:hypothetical protein